MSDTNLGDITDYMPRGLMEWAPVIGASAAASGSVLARMFAPPGSWFARNADVTGWLLSSAIAGAMYASPGTRPGAMMTFLGGTAAALPKILEAMLAKPAAVSGIGYYAAETANPLLAGSGMGIVRADQLGYATASQQPPSYGTVPGVAGIGGVAGPTADMGAPINLLGPGSHMALARHYGATHMG